MRKISNDFQLTIPSNSLIERSFPIEELATLASKEGNQKKPIYKIHKWWARRLGTNFRMILLAAILDSNRHLSSLMNEFYSCHKINNLKLLDPFMGGGTVIVEGNKLGFNTIGIDIDPVAWFTTKKEVDISDEEKIIHAFKVIEKKLSDETLSHYKTKLSNGLIADVINYFWVDLIKCEKCHHLFKAHIHHMLFKNKKEKVVFCKFCNTIHIISSNDKKFKCTDCKKITIVDKGNVNRGKYKCPKCKYESRIADMNLQTPLEKKLFALEYIHPLIDERFYKKAEKYDTYLYNKVCKEFEKKKKNLKFPREPIPQEKRSDNRPINFGYKNYYQLFNKRQLLSLSLIYNEICKINDSNIREFLLIAFSDCLANNNLFCMYAFGYRKKTPLFGIHSYRYITQPVEGNVWGIKYGRGSFIKCYKKMLNAKRFSRDPYEFFYKDGNPIKIKTGETIEKKVLYEIDKDFDRDNQSFLLNRDSTNLSGIQSGSIDMILTDPPYYDNLSYSELSDFYYVWLRDLLPHKNMETLWNESHTPYKEAIFVQKNNRDSEKIYEKKLIKVFSECSRVIKKNGLFIFTFHHKNHKAWIAIFKALKENDWQVKNVFPVLSEGKSGFHSKTGNIKWDIVFICRKNINFICTNLFSEKRFSNWIENRVKKWDERLNKNDLIFGENEKRSLKFSLAIQYLIEKNIYKTDVFQHFN